MRTRVLAALLVAAGLGACGARSQPYRFSMPMLGHADVPPAELRAATPPTEDLTRRAAEAGPRSNGGRPRMRYAYGWQKDAQAGIRVASAAGIELKQPEASSEYALSVASTGIARVIETQGLAATRLPAPHRTLGGGTKDGVLDRVASAASAVQIREPADLRHLVGVRDRRDAAMIVLSWLGELGVSFLSGEAALQTSRSMLDVPTDGPTLVTWAATHDALLPPTEPVRPGDILVFDHAVGTTEADLIAVAIGRDARGVTDFIYAGGGVIRRGFLDAARPIIRRDLDGTVINTFLRHGSKWPPKGTRYLAGELLSHVVRVAPRRDVAAR